VTVSRVDTLTPGEDTVRMADTKRTPAETDAALVANRERRERAASELDEARTELRALLAQGLAGGATVSAMARDAGISRETAHKILRKGTDHAH
jgi:transcriptional regulator of acetoin/glycerol metabolism